MYLLFIFRIAWQIRLSSESINLKDKKLLRFDRDWFVNSPDRVNVSSSSLPFFTYHLSWEPCEIIIIKLHNKIYSFINEIILTHPHLIFILFLDYSLLPNFQIFHRYIFILYICIQYSMNRLVLSNYSYSRTYYKKYFLYTVPAPPYSWLY